MIRTRRMLCAAVVASMAVVSGTTNAQTYKAHLTVLNAEKIGSAAEGDATFTVVGNSLAIHIKMKGVPANIEHWEHFHGFPDGQDAKCATADQDRNRDGHIDLGETEPVMGTTMVPFNDKPEEMNIPTHTYPNADASGVYEYSKVVPLDALQARFGETFVGHSIDLDKRVIMVHGVPEGHVLPASVGSLGPIPSHVTIPIACGKIEKVG